MPDIICQHCGSINDYRTIMKSNQDTAWCNGCDKFIKNISQGKPPTIYFGKYNGREISSMVTTDEVNYLRWVTDQNWCKSLLKRQILSHLITIVK
jgi:hypothetical protein